MSKYVNREDVISFVKGEVKDISERWARVGISLMGLEKWKEEQSITDTEKEAYGAIMEQLEGKTDKQIKNFLKVLKAKHQEQVEFFEKVNEYNKRDEEIDTMKKDRKSLEEFLEITDLFIKKFNDENK